MLKYLPQHPQPTMWQTKSHPSDKCYAKLVPRIDSKEWLQILDRIIACIPWIYNDLLISSCMQTWFVSIIPKWLNCITFSKWFISYLYVMILFHILCKRQEYTLKFSLYLLLDQSSYYQAIKFLCFSLKYV